ncbi:MAG: ATP-binding cassette domain-containing protein [Acidimicrobiales bacterium]|nr:ATP-binding cassette domain-containing protein [Acidimicrobiales bacterium]
MTSTSPVPSNTIVSGHLVVEYPTVQGTVTALDHDGFCVPAGESVAVMGPSGCGKSTLLGLLAGLATPTTGTVTIGDTVVSALPERARRAFRRDRLGMVYQADNLLPHLTVEENVALPLAVCGSTALPPPELLALLGIADLASRFPDQLSGGQRQRVAVARAVVHRPDVILADEPTGALDEANAAGVIELLVEVHRAMGATLVVVTHDPAVAAHLDRTVTMRAPRSTRAGRSVDV